LNARLHPCSNLCKRHDSARQRGTSRSLFPAKRPVVVPGSRAVSKGKGQEWGLSLYAPVIVKYRDEKTDLSTTLEEPITVDLMVQRAGKVCSDPTHSFFRREGRAKSLPRTILENSISTGGAHSLRGQCALLTSQGFPGCPYSASLRTLRGWIAGKTSFQVDFDGVRRTHADDHSKKIIGIGGLESRRRSGAPNKLKSATTRLATRFIFVNRNRLSLPPQLSLQVDPVESEAKLQFIRWGVAGPAVLPPALPRASMQSWGHG